MPPKVLLWKEVDLYDNFFIGVYSGTLHVHASLAEGSSLSCQDLDSSSLVKGAVNC